MRPQILRALFAIPVVALAAGCGPQPDASFVTNSRANELLPSVRESVEKVMAENFGTPNRLVAWERFPIDYGAADPQAREDDDRRQPGWRLKRGRNLYMTHCLHCHGVSGDGNGPTAKFLSPRPRDYRQGIFKFKSTLGALRPSRADLIRILKEGIPGTYMPSFVLLGDENLGLIVDYVRWLSCRGETESKLIVELLGEGATERDVTDRVESMKEAEKEEGEKGNKKRSSTAELRKQALAAIEKQMTDLIPGKVEELTTDVADSWKNAELPENVIIPKKKRTVPTAESIARGRQVFIGNKAKCSDCHGKSGRGNGPKTEDFDKVPNSTPERTYEVKGLHDAWGYPQQPRNLTRGVYRGGRRPIDIYRRVFAGINGTGMTGFSTSLSEDEIWDVVNYALSLPFDGKQSPWPDEAEEPAPEDKVAASGG